MKRKIDAQLIFQITTFTREVSYLELILTESESQISKLYFLLSYHLFCVAILIKRPG